MKEVEADGPFEVKLGHQAAVVSCTKHEYNQNKPQAQLEIYLKKQGDFLIYFYVLYSTLLHLPPLRFHCVGECWNLIQDCCDFDIVAFKRSNYI